LLPSYQRETALDDLMELNSIASNARQFRRSYYWLGKAGLIDHEYAAKSAEPQLITTTLSLDSVLLLEIFGLVLRLESQAFQLRQEQYVLEATHLLRKS
jgi:hypothetical protein